MVAVDGEKVEEVAKVVAAHSISVVGYLLPRNMGQVPTHLVQLVHTCRAAVLCFKQRGVR